MDGISGLEVTITLGNSDFARKLGIRLMILRGDRPRRKVAEEMGVHINTLERYENGKSRSLKFHTLERIAEYYKVSVEDLFRV